MRFSLLAAALLLAAPRAADADCALVGLTPKVINDGATLPGDGALVVAADPKIDGKLSPGDVSIQSGWMFRARAGATGYAVTIRTIAPGLSLYRMSSTKADDVKLQEGSKVIASAKQTDDKRPLLAAPVVKKLTHALHRGMHRTESVTAELDGAVPAGAIAIVMTDETGKPRSFNRIAAGKPVQPFHSFDCTPLPNGTIGSKKGDRVQVYWVDDGGRASPASAVITIQ